MSIFPYSPYSNNKKSQKQDRDQISTDSKEGAAEADVTVGSLANIGYNWFPDTINYDYLGIVRRLKNSPTGFLKNQIPDSAAYTEIAIVGAGPSGLIAAYELVRAGYKKITIIDGGQMALHRTGIGVETETGRTYARTYTSDDGFEIGAMRFPERSKLFWHYAAVSLGEDKKVFPFPNPGTIPTIFNFKGKDYLFQNKVKDLPDTVTNVRRKFLQAASSALPGYNLSAVGDLLKKSTLTNSEKNTIKAYWQEATDKYSHISFYSFCKNEARLTDCEMEILYSIGLGTGPFGHLFPISFLEILRLLLWDYRDEYSLDTSLTVQDFIYHLYDKIKNQVTFKPDTAVLGVWRRNDLNKISVETQRVDDCHHQNYMVDRVIIAVSNLSAANMMNFSNRTNKNSQTSQLSPFDPYSNFDLGDPHPPPAVTKLNKLIRAIQSSDLVISACKSFVSLEKFPWEVIPDWPRINGEPVRTIITDSLPQQGYFVNRSHSGKPAFLMSYAWGSQANKQIGLQNINKGYVRSVSSEDTQQTTTNTSINMLSFQYDQLGDFGLNGEIGKLHSVVQKCNPGVNPQDIKTKTFFWDQAPGVFGGFKLNYPGTQDLVEALAFQYKMVADQDIPDDYKKIVMAGESCSFHGGWIEGAAFAGINSAAAVMYSTAGKENLDEEIANLVDGPPR